MTDAENVNLELNIGGVRVPLAVPRQKLSAVKDTEQELRELYDTWRSRFPSKTNQELLAMIAYQYAKYYHELKDRYQAAVNATASLEYALDSLIKRAEGSPDTTPPVSGSDS